MPYKSEAARFKNYKRWYAENREEILANKRAYHHKNRDVLLAKMRIRNSGWTSEQFLAAVERQKGLCAICERTFGVKGPNADHNHKTRLPRALLCTKCNFAIGLIGESKVVAKKMAAYLDWYEAAP